MKEKAARLVDVHGDIRHLEKFDALVSLAYNVHGDIRHLEMRHLQ